MRFSVAGTARTVAGTAHTFTGRGSLEGSEDVASVEIIGEAATKVSDDTKRTLPGVPTLTGGPNFRRLLSLGWRDRWREQHHAEAEFTWYNRTRWGTFGFRVDHGLALNWPTEQPVSVRYDHTVREQRNSDHSMLLLDW